MRWKMSQGKRDIQPNLAWRRTRFESHYPPAASFLQRQCRHRGSSSLSEPDSRFENLDRDEMAEEEIQEEKEEEVQEEKDEESAGPEEKDGDDKEEDEVRTSDAQKHTPPLRRRPRRSHDIRDGRGERTGVLRRGGKARPFPIRSSASAANICRTPCLIRTCLFIFGGGRSANTQDQRMCVCVAPDKGSTQAGSGGGGAGGGGEGEGEGEGEDGAGVEEKVCTDFKGLHPIFSL